VMGSKKSGKGEKDSGNDMHFGAKGKRASDSGLVKASGLKTRNIGSKKGNHSNLGADM